MPLCQLRTRQRGGRGQGPAVGGERVCMAVKDGHIVAILYPKVGISTQQ